MLIIVFLLMLAVLFIAGWLMDIEVESLRADYAAVCRAYRDLNERVKRLEEGDDFR